jgi:hypothetical protein
VNARLQSQSDAADDWWAPGKYVGGTPAQIAFSMGTYAFGRWRDQPKVAHLGMDLVQAQILTEMLVQPIKFSTHRERPDRLQWGFRRFLARFLDLACNAEPITAVVSARRGATTAGSRTWVPRQERQRARRGRSATTVVP